MKLTLTALCCVLLFACNNDKGTATQKTSSESSSSSANSSSNISGQWEGNLSNGMKGAKISFEISEDGKELKDLTFQGYWRCGGKLDLTTLGPEKSFTIENNKVDGVITEPEGGGASAARFELHATINGDKAEGTFRMNINGLGCDTYKLNWTASRK
jgi:hypothetical protein